MKTVQTTAHDPGRSFAHGSDHSLLKSLSVIYRRKRAVTGLLIMLLLLVWPASFSFIHKAYVSTASVLIHERQSELITTLPRSDVVTTDLVAIRTQLDILQSRDLARNVVHKADLIADPYFAETPRQWSFIDEFHNLVLRPLSSSSPHFAHLVDKFLNGSSVKESDNDREEDVVSRLASAVSFGNDGRSYVIFIRAKLPAKPTDDAQSVRKLAATIANTYASEYVSYTSRLGLDTMRQMNVALDRRLNTLQERVKTTEAAVESYRAKSGLTEPLGPGASGGTLLGQQVTRLNEQLAAATGARISSEAQFESATTALARRQLGSLPETVGSQTIGRLREQQAVLSARIAQLATQSGEQYPELRAVRQQLADLDRAITAESERVLGSLKADLGAKRSHEAEIRGQLARLQDELTQQQAKSAGLIALQHEAEAARTVYAEYLRRASETANAAETDYPTVVIVSRAVPALNASAPTPFHFALAGTLVAILAACLVPVVFSKFARGFTSLEQLESETGVEVVGILPRLRRPFTKLRKLRKGDRLTDVVASVRALIRLRIGVEMKVVMVTSALPNEGKTLLASAIARDAVIAGLRVLLVDSDLRKPSILKVHGGRRALTALTEGVEGRPLIWRDPRSGVCLSRLDPGTLSPEDYLSSSQVSGFLSWARMRFDLIIVDTPPVLLVSDPRLIAQWADTSLLVVDWEKTPRRCVAATASLLAASEAGLAGIVVNRIKPVTLSRLDGVRAYVSSNYATYRKSLTNQ